MPQSVSGFDACLKEVYEKKVIDILNSKVLAWELMHKDTGPWEGRRVRYPINLARNWGVMATTENGTLPDSGSQTNVETQIGMRYVHGRIQLSAQVIKHSRSNKGSFVRAMDQEMTGLVRDIKNQLNRMMFGWGAGILCLVNGDPGTGTTITVDAPGGVAGATQGNRFIQPNQNIAFVNPSNGAIRAGGARAVSSKAAAGTTFVIGSACDGAVEDNDYVVFAAKSTSTVIGDTGYNNEPIGLLGLVDDSTYLTTLNNISRDTYPIWESAVISSVGPLSADIIQRAIDIADQRGEGETNYILGHHSTRRAYLTLTEPDRRYSGGNLSNPDAGTKAAKGKEVTFGDIPLKVDKFAPFGMLFGIDSNYFTRYVEVEGEWADDDGTILMRITDVDAFEARYRIWENYANDRPAACWRLDGIDTTIAVVDLA